MGGGMRAKEPSGFEFLPGRAGAADDDEYTRRAGKQARVGRRRVGRITGWCRAGTGCMSSGFVLRYEIIR